MFAVRVQKLETIPPRLQGARSLRTLPKRMDRGVALPA
jgi:hypothetical protein